MLEELFKYLPYLIPIILLEYGLAIGALVHVLRHRHYRFGNTVLWAIVVMVIGFIGPILYFAIGKGEAE